MKPRIRAVAIGAAAVFAVASLFFHPFGAVKAANSAAPLLTGASIDADTTAVFERSCQNCHSERTEWPWYSYLAPASLMIESDVARARRRMNLSHWEDYSTEEQEAFLIAMMGTIKTKEMPPSQYLLLHPAAKVSAEDLDRLSRWVKSERRRLKNRNTVTESGGE